MVHEPRVLFLDEPTIGLDAVAGPVTVRSRRSLCPQCLYRYGVKRQKKSSK